MRVPVYGRVATAAALIAAIVVGVSAQPAPRFRVTLLGTGSPPPKMDQFGPATLIEAGPITLLFDAGRGAMQRLNQIRVPYRRLDGLFLTHLHSDHVVGLPDLWLTGWLVGGGGGGGRGAAAPMPPRPLRLFGPKGTAAMAEHLQQAFAFDVGIRISDDGLAPEGGRLVATEVAREGVIFDEGGVRVSVFEVDHRPIVPAYGYRVDYSGRSVVLSGDTRFSENLIKWSQGVDLLVHEVAVRTGQTQETSRMLAHHTLPDQVGVVFERTKPRLGAYSHVDLSADVSHEALLEMTRATYKGPVVVGVDLMSFDIGDAVIVNRPQ